MVRVSHVLIWALLFLLNASAGMAADTKDTHFNKSSYDDLDIEAGAQVYDRICATCHGTNGENVPNVHLGSGQYHRATSELELRQVILNGIPNTGMPANKLTANEIGVLLSYLPRMKTFERGAVIRGDAERGKVLFAAKGGCTSCHRVKGDGSPVAPDLSDIGRSRKASDLQRSLMDPSSGMIPINRPVVLTLKDGKVVKGRRLNEDTYSVQITDDGGHLVSFDKSDLAKFSISMQSTMPSYRDKLTPQEISDIVTYLTTLK
jgi:putative heme-binding domain-containing protein